MAYQFLKAYTMEGYIWFHETIHSGTKSEFLNYRKDHSDADLIMKVYTNTKKELENIAKNLNQSNVLTQMKNR